MKQKFLNNFDLVICILIIILIIIIMTIDPLIQAIIWDLKLISLQTKYERIIYELTILTDLSNKDLKYIFPFNSLEVEIKELQYKNLDSYLDQLIQKIFEKSRSDSFKIKYKIYKLFSKE
jgi:hypothetical protein